MSCLHVLPDVYNKNIHIISAAHTYLLLSPPILVNLWLKPRVNKNLYHTGKASRAMPIVICNAS